MRSSPGPASRAGPVDGNWWPTGAASGAVGIAGAPDHPQARAASVAAVARGRETARERVSGTRGLSRRHELPRDQLWRGVTSGEFLVSTGERALVLLEASRAACGTTVCTVPDDACAGRHGRGDHRESSSGCAPCRGRQDGHYERFGPLPGRETAFLAATAARPTQFVTGLVDLKPAGGGPARLLDVVSGRSGRAVTDWLAERGADWCRRVRVAALNPFRGYERALRTTLPDATVVLDFFTPSASPMTPSTRCAAACSRRPSATAGERRPALQSTAIRRRHCPGSRSVVQLVIATADPRSDRSTRPNEAECTPNGMARCLLSPPALKANNRRPYTLCD